MTKTRSRPVKKEVPEAESSNSQMSFSTRTARMELNDDTIMVDHPNPLDTTGSFVSVHNHGLPGPMTPISFSGPSGFNTGATVNGDSADMFLADQSRRSMAPSTQESGVHLVGKETKALVDAINDLRKLGVDHVVQLPELVLVGDQSSGKSSLMGALTEIQLPRASGTCTRCPAWIKTSEADKWTCTVSLHREYKYNPQAGRPNAKDRPFGLWDRQYLVTTPFKTIEDNSELEEVLRWAQIAILNDSKDYRSYIPGSPTFTNNTETEAKFSPNVVSVEISGPRLPSLSFYDLPGMIQNTSDKDEAYLIKVLENLARMYIKRPRATVICAIPMAMDPALSRTRKIISDLNAEKRCVGVLTMADRLQDGQAHADYEKILRGTDHKLHHGYFITKLPGGSSGGYDPRYHAKARHQEEEFFDSVSPWSHEWAEFRGKCGTTPLQHALSQIFASQIKLSIPDMQGKIRERQHQIDQELDNLPELPFDNVLLIVIQHLSVFSGDIQKILNGGSSHNNFHSSFSKLCDQFRETVLGMKPTMVVNHPSDKVKVSNVVDLCDSDGDDTESTTTESTSKVLPQGSFSAHSVGKRVHADQETSTPTKRQRPGPPQFDGSNDAPVRPKQENGEGMPFRLATPLRQTPISNTPEKPEQNPFSDILMWHKNRRVTNMSLASIRSKIEEHTKAGHSGVVSPMVLTQLCLRSVQPWKAPCERILILTLRMLRQSARDSLDHTFAKWQQTQLYQQSVELLTGFFDDLETSQKEALEHLYFLEANNDFTVNNAAKELYKAEEGAGIRKLRQAVRAREVVNLSGRKFKDEEGRKNAEKIAEQGLIRDPFDQELEVAAYVRGYYKTAALRFVDSVCLSIHGGLFHHVREKINFFLETQLDVYEGGEERCRELLEEDAAIAIKRRDLKREKESLAKFTERLLQLADDTAALEAGDYQSTMMGDDDEI